MLLTEAEGKALLQKSGILVPQSLLVDLTQPDTHKVQEFSDTVGFPIFVKGQVLHGNRELLGLVKRAESAEELTQYLTELSTTQDQNQQPISHALLEAGISFDQQYYLSFGYDTKTRTPVIRYSEQGGTGMDDRGDSITNTPISISQQVTAFTSNPELTDLLNQLLTVFKAADATLLEINPLVKSGDDWYCLDAKIELEDTAAFRHPEWETYPTRSGLGRPPTAREKKAHQVSRSDHRGVAGESFFEFPGGTIGVMASGGGASTLAMDALMAENLHPANYTEYSGNPTREKVAALAEVVLSIPNLEALYVVGSNANFTDIYETLAGVVDGLLESPYSKQAAFCILIRRGGPRWEEAFEMVQDRLKDTPCNIQLFGPTSSLVATAAELKTMIDEAKKRK